MTKIITIENVEQIEQVKDFISRTGNIVKLAGEDDMQVSDGYHTMDELYEHRVTLWIALCRMQATRANIAEDEMLTGESKVVWRSKNHSDGEPAFGGTWFVLGIGDEKGKQITYHLPLSRWDETEFAVTLTKAPEFDGHTSADVLERLKEL